MEDHARSDRCEVEQLHTQVALTELTLLQHHDHVPGRVAVERFLEAVAASREKATRVPHLLRSRHREEVRLLAVARGSTSLHQVPALSKYRQTK